MQRRQTFCDKEKTQAWDEFQDLAWWVVKVMAGLLSHSHRVMLACNELEMQKMKEIAEQMERERDDEICLKI